MKSDDVCEVEHTGFMALTVEDSDSDVLIVSRDASPSQHEPHDIAQGVAFTSHVMPTKRPPWVANIAERFPKGLVP